MHKIWQDSSHFSGNPTVSTSQILTSLFHVVYCVVLLLFWGVNICQFILPFILSFKKRNLIECVTHTREKAMAPHSSTLAWKNPMDGGAWWAEVHGVAKSQTRLSDFTFTFHFHALEKAMATHSSVLAWRIPGTGEPHGLPSMGSHRVGHDWSDLAAECVGKGSGQGKRWARAWRASW